MKKKVNKYKRAGVSIDQGNNFVKLIKGVGLYPFQLETTL